MTDNPEKFTEAGLETIPNFFVGDIPVYGDLILSPMDGLSDMPFRSLVRKLGSAMSYTEFLNARDILFGHPDLPRKLKYLEVERPVVFQLFDDDPDRLFLAAKKILSHKPDIIDINLGCSARTVTSRGAGAALLREPAKIASIFSNLSKNLPVPVTAKIRLGWDDNSLNYLEIARIIEGAGGALIAVHGRTKMQAYGGKANWDAIAEIKQALKIPVLANGDVKTVQDIEQIKSLTGCDGVMIGRAAIENPWIFSRMERSQVNPAVVRRLILGHIDTMSDFYGPERGIILYRKYIKRILSVYSFPREDLLKILNAEDPQILKSEIEAIFNRAGNPG